jgi:hypothetical protein
MFKPVRPPVLSRNEGDERPVVAPAMISARSHILGLADGDWYAQGSLENYVVYWKPRFKKASKEA